MTKKVASENNLALEQFKFKLEKILGFRNMQENFENI